MTISAVNVPPERHPALNNLAAALFCKGDLDGAIGYLQKAASLDLKNPRLHQILDGLKKLKTERDAKIAPPPREVKRP